MTIRFIIFFTSQPSSRNCTARQSSNSGWLGGSPWEPKSSAVLTMPVPKRERRARFGAGVLNEMVTELLPLRVGTLALVKLDDFLDGLGQPLAAGSFLHAQPGRQRVGSFLILELHLGHFGGNLFLQRRYFLLGLCQRRKLFGSRDPGDRWVTRRIAVQRAAVDAVEEVERLREVLV